MAINAKTARATWKIDPDTWDLTWKVARGKKIKAGDLAGSICWNGNDEYMRVGFNGYLYYVHRLIWLITYEEWPESDIVHIDGNCLNNDIENMRLKNDDSDGWCRVRLSKLDSKWHALIKIRGKEVLVGSFKDFDSAAAAAKKASHDRYGFHSTLRTN